MFVNLSNKPYQLANIENSSCELSNKNKERKGKSVDPEN